MKLYQASLKNKMSLIFKKDYIFTYLLVLIFFSFGLIGVLNHEMWLDELQAWLIARDSTSLSDLFTNLKYEIHPALWYLCLYFITRFTQNPVAMQIFHLLLATGVIYIFVRFSPFTRLQKLLFSFGYFPFYEYAIISRNYTLGILFIFLFCTLFKTRTKSYLPLSLILAFLSNTNIFALIIAISLGITLAFEMVFDKNMLNFRLPKKRLDIVFSLLIFTLGISVAILQLIPPTDFGYKADLEKLSFFSLLSSTRGIWKSYIPIPNFFNYHFWNTNLLTTSLPGHLLSAIFSVVLFIFSVGIFIRKPIPLLLYVSGTILILLFIASSSYSGFYLRHYGHLYILFIISVWISNYYNQLNYYIRSQFFTQLMTKLSSFSNRHKKFVILMILFSQIVAGTFAYSMDLFYPFSSAKAAAQFIKSKGMIDLPIVANYTASPLSAFLNKKIYFIETEQFGSFVKCDKNWAKTNWNKKDHPEKIYKFVNQNKKDVLLILGYDLSTTNSNLKKLKIKKLADFTNSIVPDHSSYYLYLVSSQYR